MKTPSRIPRIVAVAALAAQSVPAHALTQGGTTLECTAACTVIGTVTSTKPVTSVYPFFWFKCLDGRIDTMSAEVRPTQAGPVVAGVYNYTWSITRQSRYSCIGTAELAVFLASDNYVLDTRIAPFDSQL